jgi:hypothetical protein
MVNHSTSPPIQRSNKPLINHIDVISKYVKNVSIMNKSTADEYLGRLTSFKNFISNAFVGLTVDELIIKIKEGKEDVFEVLN